MYVSVYIMFIGMVCDGNNDVERGVFMEDSIVDEAPIHTLDGTIEQIGKTRARWNEMGH